jgi:flagellar transcriptional activator FlhC
MIKLGARLQVLQAETSLSYDRLARLYREVKGCSPPKGMLPISVDWFMTWLPNIHSSMFYSVYRYLDENTPAKKCQALVQAYGLYLEQSAAGRAADFNGEPVLSFTRAWMLIRFFDSSMVQLSHCERCKGGFIAHAHDPQAGFVCAICRPPPRAGKTRPRVMSAKTAAASGATSAAIRKAGAKKAASRSSGARASTTKPAAERGAAPPAM